METSPPTTPASLPAATRTERSPFLCFLRLPPRVYGNEAEARSTEHMPLIVPGALGRWGG